MKNTFKIIFERHGWLKQKYYWRFTAENNREIAKSSENFNNLKDCEHDWILVVGNGNAAEMVYNFKHNYDQ